MLIHCLWALFLFVKSRVSVVLESPMGSFWKDFFSVCMALASSSACMWRKQLHILWHEVWTCDASALELPHTHSQQGLDHCCSMVHLFLGLWCWNWNSWEMEWCWWWLCLKLVLGCENNSFPVLAMLHLRCRPNQINASSTAYSSALCFGSEKPASLVHCWLLSLIVLG